MNSAPWSVAALLLLQLLALSDLASGQRKISRTQPVTAEVKTGINFDCPEEFGYYPHPTDCTQYYVCVFGGALLESCTGGLMYSHELQTCDWPRNVGCDALGEVTVTAAPSTASRSQDSTRTRYTAPPPPPPPAHQPAAVVTSRGQPRQLHHTHQEIIKQQQQLYEDADEVLPPAEEIESDRQQRVYRGQPSTVGQVQRDRDGLRHTNAIPNYSSRNEKIGVISFGTQQHSQPQHQYRKVASDFNLLVTNDLTGKRSERRKRQTQRSRHPSIDTWHGNPQGRKATHTTPLQTHPSYPSISHSSQDFQPFVLHDYKINHNTKSKNYQFFEIKTSPKHDSAGKLSGDYSFVSFGATTPRYPFQTVQYQSGKSHKLGVNVPPKVTEAVTKSFNSYYEYKNYVPGKNASTYERNADYDSKGLKNVQYPTEHKDVKPDFLSPPMVFHKTTTSKHENVSRFDLELKLLLDSLRESQNKTDRIPLTTVKPYKVRATTLSDDYYYYDDEEEIDEQIPNKTYSSQYKPSFNQNQTVPMNKHPLPDDDEYYYEEYDYPETDKINPLKSIKYSAKYNENLHNQVPHMHTTTASVTANDYHITSTLSSPSTTTTPKPIYTIRQRHRVSTRSTAKPAATTNRQRPVTSRFNEHDIRHDKLKSQRVEVTSASPAQQPSVATATARALYNGSQHYDPSHYDPYYSLYEDDVELYRDVDYSQHYSNNGQSQQTYRGTPAPAVQAAVEEPKRGNSAYIQNTYTTQDVYQQPSVPDYNEDNSFNSQVDDQNTYRQSNRQPSRGDRNELNYFEEIPATIRTTSTTTPRPIPTQKSTIAPRTSSRGRGSAHYTSSNAGSSASTSAGETVNRGTPPTRSRPTLKPSTSIVSKATEFIDIYRFPPRRPDAIYPQPQPDKTAAKCRKDVCLLPDCSCGGKEIPGDIQVEQVPQIVLLTFDDSVNDLNKGLYSDLFEKGRVNPNGCPISATFYVSHEWTDYSQVQNLYSDGHEMASHTVSHSFGEQFSQKKWTREVAGQREILSAYGGVKLEDVRGMRAPFLSVGGNKMFKMLYDSNFTYDSSMPIYENKPPSWPYTLDYKLFHDCMIPPCPTRSYPGVWEVPMVMWQDLNGGRCSMGDACSNPGESDGVFKMLMKNFDRHYNSNRAPFGLFYHAAWFTQPHHKEGFIKFLDTINQMKDVFLVTNWQALEWVRDPTPMSKINNFQPFQCNYSDRPKRCNNPKVCNLWHKSGVRYMRTCQPCPDIYPWTGNSGIRSSRIDNDIED